MLVTQGPLQWPVLPQCDYTALGLSPAQVTVAEQLAVDWLWRLTGRQFGTREVVERPQALARWRGWSDVPSWLFAMLGSGNSWPFDSDPRTGYSATSQVVELVSGAHSVTAVSITDAAGSTTTVDPSGYRLEGNYLVRQDGGAWPTTQNMVAALGQPNTWSVNYSRGQVVDEFGQFCAGLLACQFAKAIVGATDCKLPYNVTTATRSGVTVARDATKGATTTGVAAVDQYVASANPNQLMQPPQVWSPDVRRNQPPYQGSYVR